MSSRYFFNVTDGEQVIRDDEGIEVSDIQAAVTAAMEVIHELHAEDSSSAEEWKGWSLEIVDGSGRVLERLSLNDPLSKGSSRH